MQFTLAHLSDVHLGPLPAIKAHQLISKRLTGYINWHRNRAGSLADATLGRVTQAVVAANADHIAVTGDLTNLALDAELRAAAIWLNQFGDPENVSVVPGNHDAYVRGALARALDIWAPWMTGDDGNAPGHSPALPYLRVREPVALIGVSSAVATPAFVAAGRFGGQQARNLGHRLGEAGRRGLFRVVLIHHPPVRHATVPAKRLYGIGRFQDIIRRHGAELVLHGHTHLAQRHWIDGAHGTQVPVIGVPAAGQSPGAKRPPGAFNLFHITRTDLGWTCGLEQWSATTQAGPLERTDQRDLM